MKVNIGPYKNWIGPYQIAQSFSFLPILERDREAFGDWLSKTWVDKFCNWVYNKSNRKIKVKLDYWDHWNADETMAIVILPLLKALKIHKHGAGMVDDEDVPEELRSISAPVKENEWDIDDNHFKRYDWMLNEVIWAFEQLQPGNDWEDQYYTTIDSKEKRTDMDDLLDLPKGKFIDYDRDGYMEHSKRIDRALVMFGKYYRSFWD